MDDFGKNLKHKFDAKLNQDLRFTCGRCLYHHNHLTGFLDTGKVWKEFMAGNEQQISVFSLSGVSS